MSSAAASDTAAAVLAIRVPRDVIAQAVTDVLAGYDFAHAAAWSTEGCPCQEARGEGQDERSGCITWQLYNACQGHAEDVPLPPEQSITADQLTAALPSPDKDGMVSIGDAWTAMGELAITRLAQTGQDYRFRQLRRLLTDALAELAGTPAIRAAREAAVVLESRPRCRWCGDPIPPERGDLARFCKNSHRVQAAKRKRAEKDKAEREKVAAAARKASPAATGLPSAGP